MSTLTPEETARLDQRSTAAREFVVRAANAILNYSEDTDEEMQAAEASIQELDRETKLGVYGFLVGLAAVVRAEL